MVFAAYILTNREHLVFYIGVTGTLGDCLFDHKINRTKRTNCWRHSTRLVYYEFFEEVCDAIDRAIELDGRVAHWDINFMKSFNPGLEDLSMHWYDESELRICRQIHKPLIPANRQ
jgi:predicted GIY-YIG superfamily endonuclease